MSLNRPAGTKPHPLSLHHIDTKFTDEFNAESPAQSANGSATNANGLVRVVFLGSAKVGKTSIIQRFLHNSFDQKYTPTVEDMHSKKYIVRGHLVRLVLIDTAGSYDFPAMLRLCIAKASAFVIVFSHDNAASLTQAEILLNQIKSQRMDYTPLITTTPPGTDSHATAFHYGSLASASPPITVVCNKSDLPASNSQVNESTIMEWLLKNELKPSQFVYSSAKTNDSILSIFKSLWTQNEVTKAVSFEQWDDTHRTSFYATRPNTPPSTSTATDFSAISESMAPRTSACNTEEGEMYTEKDAHKSRANIFRSSLRIRRRSSSKSTKAKPDMLRLECSIS